MGFHGARPAIFCNSIARSPPADFGVSTGTILAAVRITGCGLSAQPPQKLPRQQRLHPVPQLTCCMDSRPTARSSSRKHRLLAQRHMRLRRQPHRALRQVGLWAATVVAQVMVCASIDSMATVAAIVAGSRLTAPSPRSPWQLQPIPMNARVPQCAFPCPRLCPGSSTCSVNRIDHA